MGIERWGTFSVKDHLAPNPFVAEVLLYDKLVIPVPPKDDAKEFTRWQSEQWEPEKQQILLNILGTKAKQVEWNSWRQDIFQNRLANNITVSNTVKYQSESLISGVIDPYGMTRNILAEEYIIKEEPGVTKIWPIAAFPSYEKYIADKKEFEGDTKKQQLSMVIRNKFLMPHLPDVTDSDLLKRAVDLADNPDFSYKRKRLHQWQEEMIKNEVNDQKALENMDQLLKEYNEVIGNSFKTVIWKSCFLVLNVGLGLAGAATLNPLALATAGVGVMSFLKFDVKPKIEAGEYDMAALIHDFGNEFNWE